MRDETDSRISVLLLDADRQASNALARSLRRRGLNVYESHTAEEANSRAQAGRYDYAVMDLHLGSSCDGLVALRRLREVAPALQVLILTAHADIPTAIAAIKLGASNYLIKPVSLSEILAALGRKAAPPPVRRKRSNTLRAQEILLIEAVMAQTRGNVSETARRLGLHRRSLQRKLARTRAVTQA